MNASDILPQDVSEDGLIEVLLDCARRIQAWRLPPNWSAFDWAREIGQVLSIASCEAASDFDAAIGVPLALFVHQRAMSRALTRYRQEWAYGLHFRSPCAAARHVREDGRKCSDPASGHRGRRKGESRAEAGALADCEELAEAVAALPERSRRLILLLFWEDRTECEVAEKMGISQPAINKRKHAILRALRRRIESHRLRQ